MIVVIKVVVDVVDEWDVILLDSTVPAHRILADYFADAYQALETASISDAERSEACSEELVH